MAYLTNKVKNIQGTSLYITDAIHQGFLYEGINNINVTGSLPVILDLTYYSQENPYQDVIYSEDDQNDIKIWFNNVELENAGDFVERLTMTSRILPNDGSKRFSLSNFISKEIELTIHDIDIEDIQDQVKISIGTMVENSYQYVPIGIFNIQEQPTNNHDKYVIKLRDNRVKFDFNYNAQPLIDSQYIVTTDTTYLNDKEYYSLVSAAYVLLVAGTDYEVGDSISGTVYEKKGAATKRQIFEDICTQAGVEHEVYSFDNENDEIGIYDNTITATMYIAYLAEQCGQIPVISREGELIFVDLSNPVVWRIPTSIISDDYQVGTKYSIDRVVYESGIIKYETSSDETLDTLYLNAANPYITTQSQVEAIYDKLKDFEIDSVTVSNFFLGNPAIDPYDIIEVYEDDDVDEPVIFRTLANNFYTFNGKHTQTLDTQIGVEQRTENVSKNSEATFQKWARTNIDNANAQINIQAGQITETEGEIANLLIANDGITARVSSVENDIETTSTNLSLLDDAFKIEQSKVTNLQSDINGEGGIKEQTTNNTQQLTNISKYLLYQNGVLILGETNSNFKLELEGGNNGEIRFMGNGVKLGYFNSERLYVENTTVFNNQMIAKKGDEENVNYYWHVTDDGCLDLDYGGLEE